MKALGYVRVSTEEQVKEGVSLQAQEEKIRAWAEFNNISQVQIFIDAGISGCRADNRAGLQETLATVKNGDILVVYSLSRLARSTKDTLEIAEFLEKKNADLVSLSEKIDTTTAAGKMVFRMLAVLNEFERDQISERTKVALAHKKSKGLRVGSIPYGFKLAENRKSLEIHFGEQKIIKAAKELTGNGMSLRAIAQILAVKGFKSRIGKEFSAIQIKRLIAA